MVWQYGSQTFIGFHTNGEFGFRAENSGFLNEFKTQFIQ